MACDIPSNNDMYLQDLCCKLCICYPGVDNDLLSLWPSSDSDSVILMNAFF